MRILGGRSRSQPHASFDEPLDTDLPSREGEEAWHEALINKLLLTLMRTDSLVTTTCTHAFRDR